MKICIVRHGETDWNASGRLQGREDIPLNENGISQAERCGLALHGGKWRAVYTSPLKRARQTADIIAGILSITDVFEDTDLVERDYGKASGLLPEERAARFPDGKFEGIEDWNALRDRVLNSVIRIAERFPSE
ncbi:MAG: histidine phosphatase family protein, partial [Defluviitaleaceae bacterium]|nr:histidine phosphatase family protein [Defluviitaleaceae bacterium]